MSPIRKSHNIVIMIAVGLERTVGAVCRKHAFLFGKSNVGGPGALVRGFGYGPMINVQPPGREPADLGCLGRSGGGYGARSDQNDPKK